ncbi:TPA: restriction endonuclease subunit S [Neisseria gonorrhoeae]|uniref:restriction endonuclease subunit S n=1 Tax=Neisseria gonorrhoeae TaxID=485 RepID=UPI0005E9915A|nr:restriction endonuclease subunit S [Neisseria gonorrhoeae]ANJ47365.1 restriction endonuclease subunit S [Neisseria gonorrhoeae]ANJ51772.1 restriction endonuclease subunit S [Neisseria gonorrhoeae]AZG26975.1 restriction endonuclease subunit S [Neisseria gonorrhoeae]KLS53936.1 type I restriction endonuclease subunit S [Neisseria gonorrhoeae MIA_2011_02_02]KLS56247.1 type I restriction endonuclease subunit S [Neisseria gonorrhoeae ATL_2011_05-08]
MDMQSKAKKLIEMIQTAPVEWKPLGEVLVRTKGTKITAGQMKEMHKDNAPLKIFAGGKTFALVDFDDVPDKDIHREPSIIVKSRGIIEFEYYDKPFSHKNEMWSYHSVNKHIYIKYVYYFLKTQENYFRNIGSKMQMPQIATPDTDNYKIPIPSLETQQKIVKILDKFTELEATLEATLEAELALRKRQYRYYRDLLLDFDNQIGGIADGYQCRLKNVVWKTLGEVAEYSKNRICSDKLNEHNYVGVDNLLQNREGKKLSGYVPSEGKMTEYIVNDILIGNIRPYLKKIWQADCTGGTNGDVLVIRVTDEKVNPKYLYQVLADDKFFAFNMKHAKGAKMPRGSKAAIMQYKIPIPPLPEQEKIVAILGKFDTLTHSVSEGLPHEIALRRKQYEYYREQLLAFPKAA